MIEPTANGPAPSAEFGLVFRTAREDAGMTLGQVADALHLDVAVVSALEAGRFADLPMRPYARGYVRNYARVLGLDADELVRRFDATDADRPEPSWVVPRHRVAPKTELALRPLALGYAAIVAVLLIALGAVLWTAWRVQDWQVPFLAVDSVEPLTVEPAPESPPGPPNVSPWPIVADDATEDAADGERATVVGEEPSAGEREGAPLASREPSAGEREGAPLASREPSTAALAVTDWPAQPRTQTALDTDARSLGGAVQEPELTSEGIAGAEPPAVDGAVGELTLVFDDESWVSVDDARGRQLFGDLGVNGRTVTVSGQVPLSILVGNALAVRVEFDGESVDLGPYTRENNVARLELGGG